ncbi:MAG TPA: hypothetical protein VFN23_16810 [Ktedonobacteraceae bacterium]|nr:hypothetical protein [Ktedonobacteraceae bacterium]
MPAKFSYASILHAVGQVLDQTSVGSISVQEEEDGLFVEGFDSEGQLQVQLRYDIPSLYDLLCQAENTMVEKAESHEIEGVLHRFLEQHNRELVGSTF